MVTTFICSLFADAFLSIESNEIMRIGKDVE
jgi:hypothetical protein